MDLNTLCRVPGVTGDEGRLRSLILKEARELADSVEVDRMGNVVAVCRGSDPEAQSVLLSAAMDECGFIILDAGKDGLLRYAPAGGSMDPRLCVSKPVLVGKDQVKGIIGAMAIHLQKPDARKRALPHEKLYIDIGAKSREEALSLCPRGSYAVFDSEYQPFGDGFACARALDSRAGCLTLLELMRDRYPCDVTYVFTVQSRLDSRGAVCAAYTARADVALVLCGMEAHDLGNAPEFSADAELGRGPVIRYMDQGFLADKDLYDRLIDLAESFEMRYQLSRGVKGQSDAGAFRMGPGGLRSCVLALACRHLNGPSVTASLSDIQSRYELTRTFLENS